ncbi:pectin acetylesterase [Chloropicon primus]|uniref:Pectin acetylesterase n=1 Tax=Chloropicon primus TaxID=1764295 RepID=A0A5B8MIE9_9CHLO|nr:pectin acetylesterase [Chloropicon primus]UPQ99433.1 pectin acetylesterase [Chloropicon primus]|eukprot:QDZ20223.1 pectin acetylesterase [Chloropicon primus]
MRATIVAVAVFAAVALSGVAEAVDIGKALADAFNPVKEGFDAFGDEVVAAFNPRKSFKLHTLRNREAVCLDGSPAGYWFREGWGDGKDKWLVHLEGGGACYSMEDCYERSKTVLGSSKRWPTEQTRGEPIFSTDSAKNPDFYNWNAVFVGYCDGSVYTGNASEPAVVDGKSLYFRGKSILGSTMAQLNHRQGMLGASDIVWSGSSAGAVATLYHADWLGKRLGPNVETFRAIPFSGLVFSDGPNFQGENELSKMLQWAYKAMDLRFDSPCAKDHAGEEYKCGYPETAYRYIKTPVFLSNSVYDAWTVQNADNISKKTVRANQMNDVIPYLNGQARGTWDNITETKTWSKAGNGAFITSCMTHVGGLKNPGWDGVIVDGRNLRDSISLWMQGEPSRTTRPCQYTRAPPHSCNPTCPPSELQL